MISAGRVLLMPKGEYNAATTYEMLDLVSYNGSSYVAKGTTTGNLPTNTTYWQLSAYGGSAANVAADFAVIETTGYASRHYNVGDFLVDENSQLVRATVEILQGSAIAIGTNVELKSVTELIRSVEENIALVETTPAIYSHNIGDRFWLSEVLYRATAAISIGDAIVVGTNCTLATDVSTEIDELRTDAEAADQVIKDMIAITETSATAAHNYEIGDEFIYQDALCKAKATISVGDTLVLNTNYESAGAIGDQFSDVKQALDNLTATVSDNEPYILRQGKGNMVDLDLVGGSVAWNQLAKEIVSGNWLSNDFSLSFSNGVCTATGGAQYHAIQCSQSFIKDHVFFITGAFKSSYNMGFGLGSSASNFMSQGVYTAVSGIDSYVQVNKIGKLTVNGTSIIVMNISANTSEIQFKDINVFDLTALFGPTIADYIYSLEQATAGAGVAWFRQYFKDAYYAYNAGSLQHVNPSARKAVGKNLMHYPYARDSRTEAGITYTVNGDGTIVAKGTASGTSAFYLTSLNTDFKNILNLPKGRYILSGCPQGGSVNGYSLRYGIGETYIDSDLGDGLEFDVPDTGSSNYYFYIRIASGVTVNLVFKPMIRLASVTDDTFEPYQECVANIPKVPLYGVPKLVNNKLFFDGDIRKADGSVTRKYGIVDLGTLNWAITNNCFVSQNLSSYGAAKVNTATGSANPIICSKYSSKATRDTTVNYNNLEIGLSIASIAEIVVKDSTYTDEVLFKTAMSGVYAVYELATPTTETVAPFQNPQRAFTDGIEEFIYDSGDVPVPVGNDSTYYLNDTLPQPLDYAQGVKDILDNKIDSIFKYNSEHNIESNTDLNNMKDIGVYYCTGMAVASTLSNCPVNAAFIMEVRTGNQRGTIVVQDIVYVNSTSLAKYQRSCVSGTWGSWFKFEGTVVS